LYSILSKIFLYFLFACYTLTTISQTQIYKDQGKWGIKEKEIVIIPAIHDTIFNFDSTGKVCLACAKSPGVQPNKFIKSSFITYKCSYLNRKGESLRIAVFGADSSSTFSLQKNTVSNYMGNKNTMTVATGPKKHLVDKDFNQLSSKGYHDIRLGEDPNFLIAEKKTESGFVYCGIINRREEEIIPYRYTGLKLNTKDSLIIACTAGQGTNSRDDVFDYLGKKTASYPRHVELATKNFVVQKAFEPDEHLVVLNLLNNEERNEYAEEVRYFKGDTLLMLQGGQWFTYSISTYKKTALDNKLKKQ
jgi:hypothetical protein